MNERHLCLYSDKSSQWKRGAEARSSCFKVMNQVKRRSKKKAKTQQWSNAIRNAAPHSEGISGSASQSETDLLPKDEESELLDALGSRRRRRTGALTGRHPVQGAAKGEDACCQETN